VAAHERLHEAPQMRVLRPPAGATGRDYIENEEFYHKLGVDNIIHEIGNHLEDYTEYMQKYATSSYSQSSRACR
jgi:hypothetical protein